MYRSPFEYCIAMLADHFPCLIIANWINDVSVELLDFQFYTGKFFLADSECLFA